MQAVWSFAREHAGKQNGFDHLFPPAFRNVVVLPSPPGLTFRYTNQLVNLSYQHTYFPPEQCAAYKLCQHMPLCLKFLQTARSQIEEVRDMKAYLQAVPLFQKISEPGFMEGPRLYYSSKARSSTANATLCNIPLRRYAIVCNRNRRQV